MVKISSEKQKEYGRKYYEKHKIDNKEKHNEYSKMYCRKKQAIWNSLSDEKQLENMLNYVNKKLKENTD